MTYNPYTRTMRPTSSRANKVTKKGMLKRGMYPLPAHPPAIIFSLVPVRYGPGLNVADNGGPWGPVWIYVLWSKRDENEGSFHFVERVRECKDDPRKISAMLTAELLRLRSAETDLVLSIKAALAKVRN
jgi:hypothetical protein